METTISGDRTVTILSGIWNQPGIKPGYKLLWDMNPNQSETLTVRLIPDKRTRAERMRSIIQKYAPGYEPLKELMKYRERQLRDEA